MKRLMIAIGMAAAGLSGSWAEQSAAAEAKVQKFVRFNLEEPANVGAAVGDSRVFRNTGENKRRAVYGLVEGDKVRVLEGDLFRTWKPTDKTLPLAEVKLLTPTRPTKVLALAGNYKSHLGEQSPSSNPEVFFKVPSCLIAQGAKIEIPPGTAQVDHEGELVVVIGKRARNVPVEKALDYVFGVTCGNDVSAATGRRTIGSGGAPRGPTRSGLAGR